MSPSGPGRWASGEGFPLFPNGFFQKPVSTAVLSRAVHAPLRPLVPLVKISPTITLFTDGACMKYSLTDADPLSLRTPCIATSLKLARRIAKGLGAQGAFNLATQDFNDTLGQHLVVNLGGDLNRIVVMGGADERLSQAKFRKLGTQAAQALLALPIKQAVVALAHVAVQGGRTPWKLQTLMQTLSIDAYRYHSHKSKPPKTPTLANIRLLVSSRAEAGHAVRLGAALDAGLQLARDLGNEPPNVCDPNYLLKQARKLGRKTNVTVTSLNEKKMETLGMGAFLAVSQGSDKPGQMIIIRYNGGKKADQPIALVGKGITFDTGGISLKPPAAMDEMKFDMCGAAAVLGATKAVIEARLPVNLITVVAAAENMPSGIATRPADIVTTASGQTVEILNTDAEGRLVLCDALTHVQTFKPSTIIDVATLTGACIVALGSHASAVYANDDALAEDLLKAGEDTGDRGWRMPLWEDYQTQLRSNFADMANVGGRDAGSVTAACFLHRFIDNGVQWAHMDVAGSAFQGGARKGSTGRPVPSLFKYICDRSGI